jgi:hypothetical protein
MFSASPAVTKFLYEKNVDPDTQYLPDLKFFKKATAVMVGIFSYRPNITSEQFFKYGFAEQKMLLCVDFINLVKKKHKELKIHKSLNRTRGRLTQSLDTSRFSRVSHNLGQASNYKYERLVPEKIARVTQEKPDLSTPFKSKLTSSFNYQKMQTSRC